MQCRTPEEKNTDAWKYNNACYICTWSLSVSLNNGIFRAGLTAGLWEYQRKAVTWMLRRERGEEEEEGQRPLHMFWTELPTSLEQPVYYNSQTGR